jgi:hypothetical protein
MTFQSKFLVCLQIVASGAATACGPGDPNGGWESAAVDPEVAAGKPGPSPVATGPFNSFISTDWMDYLPFNNPDCLRSVQRLATIDPRFIRSTQVVYDARHAFVLGTSISAGAGGSGGSEGVAPPPSWIMRISLSDGATVTRNIGSAVPLAAASDGEELYYMTTTEIRRIPVLFTSTSASRRIVDLRTDAYGDPTPGIAVGPEHVYWGQEAGLFKACKGGTCPRSTTLTGGAVGNEPRARLADSEWLHFTGPVSPGPCSARLRRVRADAGGVVVGAEMVAQSDHCDTFQDLTTDADNFYWRGDSAIQWAPRAGVGDGRPEGFATRGRTLGVAVDERHVYFAYRQAASWRDPPEYDWIERRSKSSGSVEWCRWGPALDSSGSPPMSLRVASGHLYWFRDNDLLRGRIQ